MKNKIEKLIQVLEHKQDTEFKRYGKSDFFFFLEDAIYEIKELQERWEKQ